MKLYEMEYENYYNNEKEIKKCDVDKIDVKGDMLFEKYLTDLRDEIIEFQREMFSRITRISWLQRKFCYDGERMISKANSSIKLNSAFTSFMRGYIGFEDKAFLGNDIFKIISGYLDSFFINFDELNPFDVELEYPYKYMNFDSLILVNRMQDRIELLKIGEDRKMKYTDFFDYIINHVLCYNEEHGDMYTLNKSRNIPPYIRIL